MYSVVWYGNINADHDSKEKRTQDPWVCFKTPSAPIKTSVCIYVWLQLSIAVARVLDG